MDCHWSRRVMRGTTLAALIAAFLAAGTVATALTSAVAPRILTASQEAQLLAPNGAAHDTFGTSVATSGDTVVVGASGDAVDPVGAVGSARVFVWSLGRWARQGRLTASDPALGDSFGAAAAISAETIVVGAPGRPAVYVFVRTGVEWTQQAKLTVTDGTDGGQFGRAVAIDGDCVVVGAARAAYVFVRSGTEWVQQAKLAVDGALEADQFGSSVAVASDVAVVGAPLSDVGGLDQGAAYAFTRTGETWSGATWLEPLHPSAGAQFGSAVATTEDKIAVGARMDGWAGQAGQGSVMVFSRDFDGWDQAQWLRWSAARPNDHLGSSISMSDGKIAAGAPGADVGTIRDKGLVVVYEGNGAGSWDTQWTASARGGASGDGFGSSVGLAENTLVVGAPNDTVNDHAQQGSARVFHAGPPHIPEAPMAKSPKGLISDRTPKFEWIGTYGSNSYSLRVYRGTRLLVKKTGILWAGWFCDKRLPRGVYLTWKVRGVGVDGAGPWSARLKFKIR